MGISPSGCLRVFFSANKLSHAAFQFRWVHKYVAKCAVLQSTPKTTASRRDRPAASSRPSDQQQKKPDDRMYLVASAQQSDDVEWRNVGLSAVDWWCRRLERSGGPCSSRPGISVLSYADTDAPVLRACTSLAVEHEASAVHHAAVVSDHHGRTCECSWRDRLQRSAHDVASQLRGIWLMIRKFFSDDSVVD